MASPEALEEDLDGVYFAVIPERYRFFGVERSLPGLTWREARGKNLLEMPAIGYFAARTMATRGLGPLGLIFCSLGGSPLEAWLNVEELETLDSHRANTLRSWTPTRVAMVERTNKDTRRTWEATLPTLPEDVVSWGRRVSWKPLSQRVSPQEPGVFWYRSWFALDAMDCGDGGGFLDLGCIKDRDDCWVNGTWVGQTGYQYPPRWYEIPPGILVPGENQIVIRVQAESYGSGFLPGKPVRLFSGNKGLYRRGGLVCGPGTRPELTLEQGWELYQEAITLPIKAELALRWEPTVLYQGMMAALDKTFFHAVVWYQGESNTRAPHGYARGLEILMGRWAKNLGVHGKVYVIQLPRFRGEDGDTEQWAWLRHEQRQACTRNPRSILVPALDLGDKNDIHPTDKEALGDRLGMAMLHHSFDRNDCAWQGVPGDDPRWELREGYGALVWTDSLPMGAQGGATRIPLYWSSPQAENKCVFWAKLDQGSRGSALVLPPELEQNKGILIWYAWKNYPDGPLLLREDGVPLAPFVVAIP